MKWSVAVVAAALSAAVAAAQQPSPQQPSAQQPPQVFRAGTDVIEVEAVVHDRSGRAVLDLGPGDFTVEEDGTPRNVDLFYLVRGSAVVTPARNAASEPATVPTAAAPIVRRAFIVVVDADHLTPGGFKRAQAAATTLFSKQFHDTDVGGVVVNGQMANKRLTSNREELLKAVAAAKPTSKSNSRVFDLREWPSMNDAEAFQIAQKGGRNNEVFAAVLRRACADDPDACKREPPDAAVLEKAQRMANEIRVSSDQTLRTLAALMNGLDRLDGRKSILLLSEGFIADESWPIVQQVVGLAARANARVYSLDARGLDKGRQPIGNYAPHDDSLGNLLASFDIGADSINSLAVDTGGYVVRNTNIFDEAIAEIADEAGTYYVLGYLSDHSADGKFHRIAVKVNRSGVTVRARRGYVATPRPASTTTSAGSAVAAPGAGRPPADARAAVERIERADRATDVPLDSAVAAFPTTALEPAPGAIVGSTVPAGLRLRPDAAKHADTLGAADDPDGQARAGWDAYQHGDLETAKVGLAAAATSATAHAWVHYALGQTDYGLRDYPGAATEWEKVRAAVPEFEPVYFDLVDAYLQLKEYDRATEAMRSAAGRWPTDADVFNALGVVQVARGSLDDSIKSFEHAIANRPDEAVGYFNLGRAHELRYVKSRRWVETLRSWVSNKQDAEAAVNAYKRYLAIGGPLENSAREGLSRLNWSAGQPR